jgi:hypothetical protein
MSFNKGSELDKQIYPEGKPTWGCKYGFLDVEDVKEFIKELKPLLCWEEDHKLDGHCYPCDIIDELAGEKLI